MGHIGYIHNLALPVCSQGPLSETGQGDGRIYPEITRQVTPGSNNPTLGFVRITLYTNLSIINIMTQLLRVLATFFISNGH